MNPNLVKKKVLIHPSNGRPPFYAFRYVNENGEEKYHYATEYNNEEHEPEDDGNEDSSDEDRIKHLQKKMMTERNKDSIKKHKEELDSLKKRKDSGKTYLELLEEEAGNENKKDYKQLEDHRSDEEKHEVHPDDLKDSHIVEAEDEDEEDDDSHFEDEDEDEDDEDDPEWKELTKNNKFAKSKIFKVKKKLIKISKGKYGRF